MHPTSLPEERPVPLRSGDRWLAALALVVTAAAHVPLVPEHLREAPYVGYSFALLVGVSLLLAVLLVVSDRRIVWQATLVVTAAALVAYLLSRTVGLPMLGDDVGNWREPLSFPALAGELIAAALAVGVLVPRRVPASSAPEAQPGG